jgi:hypothetical protein
MSEFLSDVLSDETQREPVPETVPEPVPETVETTGVKTEAAAPEPVPADAPIQDAVPPADKPSPQTVPIEGLLDERRKRQDLERKLQELEQRIQEKRLEAEKKDFWEAPEDHLREMESRLEQRLVAERLNLSEAFAREKYADYDEKFNHFRDLAKESPALVHEMLRADNPAEFVYKTAAKHLEVTKAGSIDAYIKAEIEKAKAEIKKGYELKLQEELKKRDAIPTTLTGLPSGISPTPAEYTGPTPLDDILG